MRLKTENFVIERKAKQSHATQDHKILRLLRRPVPAGLLAITKNKAYCGSFNQIYINVSPEWDLRRIVLAYREVKPSNTIC